MRKIISLATISILIFLVIGGFYVISNIDLAVLQPVGDVGKQQSDLLIFSLLLSLIIIIPVFSLTFFIAVRYREGNKKVTYKPDWGHSKLLETIWWGVPVLLITILSIIIWQSSHNLDPSKPLSSSQPPLKVQVVALQWRWLFIYPEQSIATVNKLILPVNRSVEFKLTSDAPMNSFWIPKLGGQIYAMPGMVTTLNLNATELGQYVGKSTNISGVGYADMEFPVHVLSSNDFEKWVNDSTGNDEIFLSNNEYEQLSQPVRDRSQLLFSRVENELFNEIVNKYMMPNKNNTEKVTIPSANNKLNTGSH